MVFRQFSPDGPESRDGQRTRRRSGHGNHLLSPPILPISGTRVTSLSPSTHSIGEIPIARTPHSCLRPSRVYPRFQVGRGTGYRSAARKDWEVHHDFQVLRESPGVSPLLDCPSSALSLDAPSRFSPDAESGEAQEILYDDDPLWHDRAMRAFDFHSSPGSITARRPNWLPTYVVASMGRPKRSP